MLMKLAMVALIEQSQPDLSVLDIRTRSSARPDRRVRHSHRLHIASAMCMH